eukprot:2110386-Pyramimonas_sp.AAC.1
MHRTGDGRHSTTGTRAASAKRCVTVTTSAAPTEADNQPALHGPFPAAAAAGKATSTSLHPSSPKCT